MSRNLLYLFCLFTFFSQLNAYESDGYELTQFEEDNISDDEEEMDENEAYFGLNPLAKSVFKPVSEKELDANNALITLESGPTAIVAGCVNAITGAFFDSHTPLIISGAMPLAVQCTYCSSEKKWRFHHMPKLRVGYSGGEHHLRASYLDDNGSGMAFGVRTHEKYPNQGLKGKLTVPESVFEKGLTNCESGEISGKTSWRNVSLALVQRARKTSNRSYALNHGSNIKRIFTRYKRFGKKKEAPTGKFRLTSEQHPNGNCLLYQYGNSELKQIKAINKNNELLNILQRSSNPFSNQTMWCGASGNVLVSFKDKKKKYIEKLSSSEDVSLSYVYNKGLLSEKNLPDGRFLRIGYYLNQERVCSLTNPIGTTHIFRYSPGNTEVINGENHATNYRFDKKTKRLQSVSQVDNQNKLLAKDIFEWSTKGITTGNLIARTFLDECKTYFKRTFGYDDFGNVKHDTLYGNLTGKSSQFSMDRFGNINNSVERIIKTYIYSQDGRNHLIEEHEDKKSILYFYSPLTQLRFNGLP